MYACINEIGAEFFEGAPTPAAQTPISTTHPRLSIRELTL